LLYVLIVAWLFVLYQQQNGSDNWSNQLNIGMLLHRLGVE
jgi:hypothetical protein